MGALQGCARSRESPAAGWALLACVTIVFQDPRGRALHIIPFKSQGLEALVVNHIFGDNVDRGLFVPTALFVFQVPLRRICSGMKKMLFINLLFYPVDSKSLRKPNHPSKLEHSSSQLLGWF